MFKALVTARINLQKWRQKWGQKGGKKSPAVSGLLITLGLIGFLHGDPALAQRKGASKATPKSVEAAASPAPSGSPSQCGEEDALPSSKGSDNRVTETRFADPRAQLNELIQVALRRSQTVGVANLLAEAARADWDEAKAAKLPQVNLSANLANAGNKLQGYNLQQGLQAQASVNVSAPLYDFGRNDKLANWRSQLAEGARQGLINAEQQLALQTVSLAMDRNRFQLQSQVYTQYVRRMACLVDALDTIVKADRGRASELTQAIKNRQQAELAVLQTKSALAQTEVRLRRLVGDDLPTGAVYSALLNQVPDLSEMQRDVTLAPEVVQLEAQARAQANFADSVAAGYKPQVNLLMNGQATNTQQTKRGEWVAGISVNVPLFNATAAPAINAARKRAQAAALQREDAIATRNYRMAEVHEAATSAFERARSTVEILRNSDRLRASTLQQWQQLGRRSLFDVMGTEAEYFSLRVAHVNALFDGQQAVALLWSLGRGVQEPLR